LSIDDLIVLMRTVELDLSAMIVRIEVPRGTPYTVSGKSSSDWTCHS
jgi:hypothetical protein